MMLLYLFPDPATRRSDQRGLSELRQGLQEQTESPEPPIQENLLEKNLKLLNDVSRNDLLEWLMLQTNLPTCSHITVLT